MSQFWLRHRFLPCFLPLPDELVFVDFAFVISTFSIESIPLDPKVKVT